MTQPRTSTEAVADFPKRCAWIRSQFKSRTVATRHTCISVALILLSFASVAPSAYAGSPSPHPIVGTWEWKTERTKCTEIYTYRRDGTALVESADDRNEDAYEISAATEGNNRHRMKVTTVKDNGGKDCSGSDKNTTGDSTTVYVEFDSSYNEMLVCLDAMSYRCFGPLRRVSR